MELEMHMDEYLPLRDVVFNTLRAAILKGELKPGERQGLTTALHTRQSFAYPFFQD